MRTQLYQFQIQSSVGRKKVHATLIETWLGVQTGPLASELCEGDTSTRVRFSLPIFLYSHSSVGILMDTLPAGCVLGPGKGLSSDVEVAESISGICVHPMKDQIPLIVSL